MTENTLAHYKTHMQAFAHALGENVYLFDNDKNFLFGYSYLKEEIPVEEWMIEEIQHKDLIFQVQLMDAKKEVALFLIPMKDSFILFINENHRNRRTTLINKLKDTLPIIAYVAEGSAYLFDAQGKIIQDALPTGRQNNKRNTLVSPSAKQSLDKQETILTHSEYIRNVQNVYIPLTKTLGIGFDNQLHIERYEELLNQLSVNRTATHIMDDIIGSSEKISIVKDTCELISKNNSAVFLYGETGTGKEMFAEAIHNQSPRKHNPFVLVHCSSLPEHIMEKYLFGSKNGGKGALVDAFGGTVFLDEVSNLSLSMQKKLAEVLENKSILDAETEESIPLDIRLITATNRNISELITHGTFLETLYHKINLVEIRIPPLRERISDVEELSYFFLEKFSKIHGKLINNISTEAQELFSEYSWPGNIRELEEVIEYAVGSASFIENTIEAKHLPVYIREGTEENITGEVMPYLSLEYHVAETEKKMIMLALNKSKNNKTKAADMLGISQVTLWRKLKEYNITST